MGGLHITKKGSIYVAKPVAFSAGSNKYVIQKPTCLAQQMKKGK